MRNLFLMALLLMMPLGVSSDTRKQLFNDGWSFMLADIPEAKAPDFDSRGWQKITLPHDWSIGERFDRNAPAGNDGGYLPAGTGWYRKAFTLPAAPAGRKVQLYFEGVYMNSEVFVNGHPAGGHPYGYSSFFVDVTPYVTKGRNVVAVRVDNSQQKNCRWYSGSGIYRNVWLVETGLARIDNYGVHIVTPDLNTAVVSTTVVSDREVAAPLEVTVEVAGVTASGRCSVKAVGEPVTVSQTLRLPGAKTWSPSSPNLYTARITVREDGRIIDEVEETFGFRTVAWSADGGFLLNGEPLLLNGGCVHHDNGILGAAAFDRAEHYRVEQMKKAGFNALRTSHNVPSETFLRACDEVGMLVIDEAFDGWRDKKNDYDYHMLFDRWWQADVSSMVLRDRNHPSVFCWSIGNEVIERKKIEVVTTAHKLAGLCRRLDPTRPVTSALAAWDKDWEIYDPLAAEHDITGYNYMIHKSEGDHRRVPSRVMMQTESYPNDAWKNYRKVKDNTYIIGDFVWTAMDYIGESGIGRWYYKGDVEGEHYHRPLYPWHASYCGDIDLTGLRKPISHYRSMLWNEDGEHLFIAVKEPDGYRGQIKTTLWGTWPTFESWNWPGHEGRSIDVEVYSHYPKVRLYLNDRLIGDAEVREMKAVFAVPYAPGVLRAEGLDGGAVRETATLATAGEPAALRLTPDRSRIKADGQDLSFVVIELVDAEGRTVPTAGDGLTVSVGGAAVLQALGNADIKDEDPYFDNTHRAWHGRALAVVRSNGRRGKSAVTVTATGRDGRRFSKTIKLTAE